MNSQIEFLKPKERIKENGPLGLKPMSFKSDKINDDIRNFFKKKIKFNSAFDHKGSKHFLHSKNEALQQIVIDEDSSNNDSDTQSGSIKKKYKNRHVKTCINNKARSSIYLDNVMNNNLKNKTGDSKDKNFRKENMIRTLVINELNVNKRLKKNFSSQELKMFGDREIRKIKPIKKKKADKNDDENKNNCFPFVEGDNSIDSSLMKMVSQIK